MRDRFCSIVVALSELGVLHGIRPGDGHRLRDLVSCLSMRCFEQDYVWACFNSASKYFFLRLKQPVSLVSASEGVLAWILRE